VADTFWKDGNVTWKDGDVSWLPGASLLVVADSTHAHSADNIAITQKHTLVVASATHDHTVDVGAISLHLVPSDTLHTQRTGSTAPIWADGDVTWVGDDVDWLDGVFNPDIILVEHKTLVVASATHDHSVDAITIVVDLVIADSTHDHTVDNVAITQAHILAANNSTHAHSVNNVFIDQKQILVPIDAIHAHSVDNVDILHYRSYPLENTQWYLVQEVKNIVQDTTYSYDYILDKLNESQLLISGGILLVYPDRTQVFSSPLEDLETSDTVTASASAAYVSLPSNYQRELFYIYNDSAPGFVNMVNAFGGLLNSNPSLDRERNVTDAVIEGNKLYYQGIPGDAQTLTLNYFRKPHEMATYTSSGISFSGTTILDSNDGLGVFYAGQTIDIEGNYANSGEHVIVSVEDDGSGMTVSDSSTTESAGSSLTIRSRPDGIPEHLQKELLVNHAVMKILQRKLVFGSTVDLTMEYRQGFYRAMIDLETDVERTRSPIQLRNAA